MSTELIEVEGPNGERATIPRARLKRYPSLAATFRPVPATKAAPAAKNPPPGDNKKES